MTHTTMIWVYTSINNRALCAKCKILLSKTLVSNTCPVMVTLYVFMVYPNIKQHTLCRKNLILFFTQKHEQDHLGHILSPGPVWPQDLVDITGDVLLGQTAGEEAPGVAHEALAGLTRYIPTRLTHCLKQWDLLCGVPLIYLPSPRRENYSMGFRKGEYGGR